MYRWRGPRCFEGATKSVSLLPLSVILILSGYSPPNLRPIIPKFNLGIVPYDPRDLFLIENI